MSKLSDIVNYCDEYLRIADIGDYDNALNGLQIENDGRVSRIGAAVDVSTRALDEAVAKQVDLLIVHHGLFWPGLQPIRGSLRRQIKLAFENNIALYSVHLPLDAHPAVGNNAQLARALGFERLEPFLEVKGQPIGLRASVLLPVTEIVQRLEKALAGNVQKFLHGPEQSKNVALVTGGAGGEAYAVARDGIDTFITGEAPHSAAVAAQELGMNLLLGGHYATETFGVKALSAHLSEKFGLSWEFIDCPTGL